MANRLAYVNLIAAGLACLIGGCHCPGAFCVDRGMGPCGYMETGYQGGPEMGCAADMSCSAQPGCGCETACSSQGCQSCSSGSCGGGCGFENCQIYWPDNERPPLPPATCGMEPTCAAPGCGLEPSCGAPSNWRGVNRPPQIISRSPWNSLCGAFGRCNGCGDCYWSEWYSDPPDCCDPCNRCADWIGPQSCGAQRKMGFTRMFWGQQMGGRNGYPPRSQGSYVGDGINDMAPHVTAAYIDANPVVKRYPQRSDADTETPFKPSENGGSAGGNEEAYYGNQPGRTTMRQRSYR